MSRGTGKKDVVLCNHPKECETPLPPRSAPFDKPKTRNEHSRSADKAVQMTQNWVSIVIFGKLRFNPFHILKIDIKHIGFNVGL